MNLIQAFGYICINSFGVCTVLFNLADYVERDCSFSEKTRSTVRPLAVFSREIYRKTDIMLNKKINIFRFGN